MTHSVAQTEITEKLATLGITPTCCLMVHASLSAFGRVEGGATTVVAALREAAGNGGAVLIPSFRGSIRSDHYALRECQSVCPQDLCPSRERGYTGIVGEIVRSQPDMLRSCSPGHSWVGVGDDARFLLSGHRKSLTPCGTESPFFRLMERDGILLLLGVGVNSVTNIHAVEDARNLPYLSAFDQVRRHATYTTSGRRIQYTYPQLLQEVFENAGVLRSVQIGQATCHAISARDLGSLLWVVTDDDPWCLVLRPTRCVYEPEEDARTKTTRMAEAWQRNPDRDAWRQLLEASRRQQEPISFQPSEQPRTQCPAYRGKVRGYHRCAANDIPPSEKFEDYPQDEPGAATCQQCNWPEHRPLSEGPQP